MLAKRHLLATILAAAAAAFVASGPGLAQTPSPAQGDDAVLGLIPGEAIFYLERRGHEATKKAFDESSLGEMARDEAIKQFVTDSRINIGKKIVEALLPGGSPEDVAKNQDLLHKVCKPIWYNPCAVFLVPTEGKFTKPPGVGIICIVGDKYRKDAKDSLDALMKAAAGNNSDRSPFEYTTGKLTFRGVVGGVQAGTLPKEAPKLAAELAKHSLFMTCWADNTLLAATNLTAGDAIAKAMAQPGKNKNADPVLKTVLGKTTMKDWAFRWYIDVAQIKKLSMAEQDASERAQITQYLTVLGFNNVRGVGGTGGFEDKVYSRQTYIDSPNTTGGVLRVLKDGGSYKTGLSMVPTNSAFLLAGQIDAKALTGMIRGIMVGQAQVRVGHTTVTSEALGGAKEETTTSQTATSEATSEPASAPAPEVKIDEEELKVLKQIELLAGASNGNVGMFITDFQTLGGMAMGMGGGPPIGFVMDIKNAAQAAAAIGELIKLTGGEGPSDNAPAGSAEYRKVPIRHLGEMVFLASLGDRVVLGMSDVAVKAAIDAALDKKGGFAAKSKEETLTKLCGNGSGVFMMDLAALARFGWPLLMQAAQGTTGEFPFVSLPTTEKLTTFLGPEVAVFQGDAGGLLIKSRGKIPFATKFLMTFPMGGPMIFFYLAESVPAPAPAAVAGPAARPAPGHPQRAPESIELVE